MVFIFIGYKCSDEESIILSEKCNDDIKFDMSDPDTHSKPLMLNGIPAYGINGIYYCVQHYINCMEDLSGQLSTIYIDYTKLPKPNDERFKLYIVPERDN